jgi:hypothetical protein
MQRGRVLQSHICEPLSIASHRWLQVIMDMGHAGPSIRNAIGTSRFITRAVSRAVTVGFKPPIHVGYRRAVLDVQRRHRQTKETLKAHCLIQVLPQSLFALCSTLFQRRSNTIGGYPGIDGLIFGSNERIWLRGEFYDPFGFRLLPSCMDWSTIMAAMKVDDRC